MLTRLLVSLIASVLAATGVGLAPASADTPSVSFIGDSWTRGTGTADLLGYAPRTADALGWEGRVLGIGGSGYTRPLSAKFRYRIASAVAGNPDVIVIQGSINERTTPTATLRVAVRATLTSLRNAAGSDTTVLVLGASYVPGKQVTRHTTDRINNVLRTQARALGLRFVDVAAANWSDPKDPTIWADPYHVNDRGAQRIADRLAPILRKVAA